MKYFLICLLILQVRISAQDGKEEDLKKYIPISIKAGVKFPEEINYRSTDIGISFGIEIPWDFDEKWIGYPGFLLWSAKTTEHIYQDNVTVRDFTFLVGYKFRIDQFLIIPLTGPGIASEGGNGMLSWTLALKTLYEITEETKLLAEFRKQTAANFNIGGGGSSYAPFLFLFGIEYKHSF